MITIPGAIPIRIHPVFWVMAFVIGWLSSNQGVFETLLWVVVITVSVLVHEFGHALTAKAFGQQVQVHLVGLGGMTHRRGGKISSWKEFLIVLNGPLAGFSLFIISAILLEGYGHRTAGSISYMLQVALLVNFYWTILNLLPIYPLDGGQLLRIVLEGIFGLKGVKIALFVSMIVSSLFTVLFLWQQQIIAAAIFLLLTYEGYKTWYNALEMTEADRKEDLQKEIKSAEGDIRGGDLESAKIKLIGIRDKSKSGVIYQAATQYLADLLDQQGRLEEAYELLVPIEKNMSLQGLTLFHKLAYKKKDFTKTVELGNKVFQQQPRYETALVNAFACAQMGDARSAVGWLRCAEREGLGNLQEMLAHPEFDRIRTDPQFLELVK